MTSIALTIAGSDSGGGAGIQADLKTFSALGAYGASVITAITAQNTMGVQGIQDIPPEFVGKQIESVFSDLDVSSVKIGMLSNPAIILEVAKRIKNHKCGNVVLDPVMVSATGDPLIDDDAVEVLVEELFPLCSLVTPNLHEAARILNRETAKNEEEMAEQAESIIKFGPRSVLIKGGHGIGKTCSDILLQQNGAEWFHADRVVTSNTHGTGCTLSSAVAANLAKGLSLTESVRNAKDYISKAIAAADKLKIGAGCGPVHHFHGIWK